MPVPEARKIIVGYVFPDGLSDQVVNGGSVSHDTPFLSIATAFQEVKEVIRQLDNDAVAQESQKLLSILHESLTELQRLRFNLSSIPPLHAVSVGDGSVLLEWIFKDYRVGFSLEPQPEESSWFLITNQNLGEISAAGYLARVNLKSLILWLLGFILSHS